MPTDKTLAALSEWRASHQHTQLAHRQLLVVSGTAQYCKNVVKHLFSLCHDDTLLLGKTLFPENTSRGMGAYRTILGTEYALAVVDSFEAFRPNAILAVAGTVTQGGLLVLCCPDFAHWPAYQEVSTSHYLSYGEQLQCSVLRTAMIEQFKTDPSVAIAREHHPLILPQIRLASARPETTLPFKTTEQQTLFTRLTADKPVHNALLTADRGRGKSTLLGMIAGHCLAIQNKSVMLTSRYAESVSQVFAGLLLTCPKAIHTDRHRMVYQDTSCKWLPLDHPALTTLDDTDVLLIDEAASIPVPQLTALCSQAGSVLLSSTMRGYEGSGRGFITRFIPWLRQHRPDIEHHELLSPIRWYEGDPVERFWYQALCLEDARPAAAEKGNEPINQVSHYQPLVKQQYHDATSRQLLPLLMQAHYQTTADELVRLYDAPTNNTLLAMADKEVVGVINYQQEGGALLQDVATGIASGARRVNGHMSAQGLSVLLASASIATATFWRINRIAVLPRYRRQGVASRLIHLLAEQARQAGIDALTTSYGATPELTRFWQTNRFLPAKPGLKRDASSGEYSLLMVLPLSERIGVEQALITQRFSQELLLHPAADTFGCGSADTAFNLNDKIKTCSVNILHQVVNGSRSLQHARGSVAWFVKTQTTSHMNAESIAVVRDFISDVNATDALARRYKLSGKRETEAWVTKHLSRLLEAY